MDLFTIESGSFDSHWACNQSRLLVGAGLQSKPGTQVTAAGAGNTYGSRRKLPDVRLLLDTESGTER